MEDHKNTFIMHISIHSLLKLSAVLGDGSPDEHLTTTLGSATLSNNEKSILVGHSSNFCEPAMPSAPLVDL